MDMNVFRGIVALILLLLFVGLVIWVYGKKRKGLYEKAAYMAVEDDDGDSDPGARP